VNPLLISIGQEKIKEFIAEEPKLALYEHMFDSLFRLQEHVLAPEREKVLAEAKEIGDAGDNIFSMLNDADLTFRPAKGSDGKEVEVSHGKYGGLMESTDRALRKSVFESYYEPFLAHKNTLATCYGSSVKADLFFSSQRKYSSSLEASLDSDNIQPGVYESLVQAIREALPHMHRYMKLRKKVLGVDELHMYDLFTPIVPDVDTEMTYEKAKETVLESLKPLGAEYVEAAREGLAGGWVDVLENKGKRSGAFAWGAFGCHPFVLLNYDGKIDDMFTLAHEMGHAMHSWHTWGNQPYAYADYPIFLAEVASTVNESLLLDHLRRTETDPRKKAYLVNFFLEQFRTTVFRQTMFAEFEKRTHELAEASEALTSESLNALYLELNKAYYGEDVVSDDQIAYEWSRVPHFYNAFYVYKYATGFSAAVAFSKRILEGGPEAVEQYKGFLKSGSSKYPVDTLKEAGVDMSTPAPVREGMQLFAQLVDEMEALEKELSK
jgi:oligoendopeptidase F